MLVPHPVRFGLMDMDPLTGAQPVCLASPTGLQGWRDDAQHAERLGFDVLWCADHLFYFLAPDAPFLDGWALLPAWAAITTTIRLGVLITNLSWRSPIQVARSAIAVDQLSAGRLELGVGTGAFGDQAMAGMLEMALRERIERLREGVGSSIGSCAVTCPPSKGNIRPTPRPTPNQGASNPRGCRSRSVPCNDVPLKWRSTWLTRGAPTQTPCFPWTRHARTSSLVFRSLRSSVRRRAATPMNFGGPYLYSTRLMPGSR